MLRQQAREQKTLSMLDTGRSKELVATAFSRMNPIHFAPAHVEKLVAEFEPTQEDEGPTEDELRLYEAFARPAPAAPTSTSTSTNDERKRT